MTAIASNLGHVKGQLPATVTLVAVSKTHPPETVMEAYDAGQRDFGENRVQEMVAKQAVLPQDIRWHQIGSLQRNKVRQIAPFVHLIHSIDSLRLLEEVDRQAQLNGRVIDVLLQFHIAQEETKQGMSHREVDEVISAARVTGMDGIRIRGVMGMATFTDDEAQVRAEFRALREAFLRLKREHFAADDAFDTVSMGMSGDFVLAVEEGSTMVRVGGAIFGRRG